MNYKRNHNLPRTSFKEFLNTVPGIDQSAIQTITALANAHPVIRNHTFIKNAVSNQTNQLSFHDLSSVLESILHRCVQIAHDMPKASAEDKSLIIAEQNVLIMSSFVLFFLSTSRQQNIIYNLSTITRGTALRK
jgi:hypothetical protein